MGKLTIIFLLFSSSILFGQNEIKNLLSLDTNSFVITPNPFVDTTNIHFEINNNDTVRLQIYNRWGNVIATLINNEVLQSGQYDYSYINDTLLNGVYYLLLKVNGEGYSKLLFKVDSINSIKKINQKDKFIFFPNPTTDFINISFNDNSNREIRLINEKGKSLIVTESSEKKIILNIQKFKSGLYILSIKNGLITTNEKILIK